jgi:hypothetical protein
VRRTTPGSADWEDVDCRGKHHMEDLRESSVELSQIVDLNGNQPFKGFAIPFVEESIIQTCP